MTVIILAIQLLESKQPLKARGSDGLEGFVFVLNGLILCVPERLIHPFKD